MSAFAASYFLVSLAGAFDSLRRHPLEIVALLCLDLFAGTAFPTAADRPTPAAQGDQVPGLIEPDRSIALGDALSDDREQLVVGHFAAADRKVGGALESRFVQLLGVRQSHGMGRDGDIVLARLIDNRAIEGGVSVLSFHPGRPPRS